MRDKRIEILSEALRRGGEATLLELLDERLRPALSVCLVDRVIERFPLGVLDAFALSLRELGIQVAGTVHAAALAV